MSKVMGPAQETEHGTAPTFVDLNGWTKPGFLGQVYSAYRPDGDGRSNLSLNRSVTSNRLDDRTSLRNDLDRMSRTIDARGDMTAVDSFTERAVGIITSGKLAAALDPQKEDRKVREAYGLEGGSGRRSRDTGNFLVARRLIEAGCRCVSFSWGGWDTHGQNFESMRKQLPSLSQGLTALIRDLDQRGRLDDTIILMSGEFGRTPRINSGAGRDHWPQAAFFFVAGGGFHHGQVIGSTNPRGERPQDRPCKLQHVFHTVYHQLGIDANTVQLTDPNGRPQYILEERELLKELV
jgi:uncharacterized protein (DUF1501 family)